jgi:N-acetylneuraminic acid mutarotase
LFGGANHEQGFLSDLYVLDLSGSLTTSDTTATNRTEWKKVQIFSSLKGPIERYEHGSFTLQNKLFIFYGCSTSGLLDDIWSLDLETNTWTELVTKGTKPSPRVISATMVGKRVYVFGGGLNNDIPVDDTSMYCFDVNNLFWCRVNVNGPRPRLGHTMTCIGTKIYMQGGMNRNEIYDELWEFDTVTNKWTLINVKLVKRCAHQMVSFQSKLYITGGMIPSPPTMFDLLEIVDVDTLRVESLKIDLKRLDHSMTVVGDKILVVGGMDFQHVFFDDQFLLPNGSLLGV